MEYCDVCDKKVDLRFGKYCSTLGCNKQLVEEKKKKPATKKHEIEQEPEPFSRKLIQPKSVKMRPFY